MRRRHGIPDNDKRPFSIAYREICVKRSEEDYGKAVQEEQERLDAIRIQQEREWQNNMLNQNNDTVSPHLAGNQLPPSTSNHSLSNV